MRPFFGIHYTWVPGYSATMTNNYDGASGVIGIKFGRFPRHDR